MNVLSSQQGLQSLKNWIVSGGVTLYPLIACSLIVWGIVFERIWVYRRLKQQLRPFQLEAISLLLQKDLTALARLCREYPDLPTAQVLTTALERIHSKDVRIQKTWKEAVDRKRQRVNQELRHFLWILGTIASSSPFIGLFGTVLGILESFREIARTGAGGFAVVAAGISEALVTTAAGIIVAVVAVVFFNGLQTRWSAWVLEMRLQIEEFVELLEADLPPSLSTEASYGLQ